MSEKVHSVKYNFFMNFILTASGLIFPLITFPYASRILHSAGMGRVNFSASVANYFLMVASLGIPTYGVRACARVRDDREKLSRTAQEILIINLIATVLVSISYLVCIWTVPRLSEDKTLFLIQGINIVLNMFGANWLYQALEKYDYITWRSILFKAISAVLMFIAVHRASDYRIYAATTVLAAVGSNVLNFARLHRYISFRRFTEYNFRQHLKPIMILFAQNATISIYTNLDNVMLGFMKPYRQVGLYTAAVKIKGILLSVVSSLGGVLLPRMSYYVSKGEKSKFNRLITLAFNAELFMSLPLVVFFTVEARDCILLLAGNGYLGAVRAMQIIDLSVVPIGLTGVIGLQTLVPLNREAQVLKSVAAGAFLDFVLNLFMIPVWGASGAAFSTMIAEYLVLAVQLYLGRDVVLGPLREASFFKYLLFTAVALIPLFISTMIPVRSAFIRLLITSPAFFGSYGLILLLKRDELMMKLLVKHRR